MSVFNRFFSGRSKSYQLLETETGEIENKMQLEKLFDNLGIEKSVAKPVLKAGFVLGVAMCLSGAGALAIGAVPAAKMFATIKSMKTGFALASGASKMLREFKNEEASTGSSLNNDYAREQVRFWLTKGSDNKRDSVSRAFLERFGDSDKSIEWDFGADRPQVVSDWLEHYGLSHESQVNRQIWDQYSAQVDSLIYNAAPQALTSRMSLG